MKKIITYLCIIIFILFAFCSDASASFRLYTQDKAEQVSIVIGHKTRMYSELLGEWRTLEIYLPDNYESSEDPYPVMVVLDGDWAFNYCVSIVDMISPNYFPRMIVVGLPNTERNRDLNPQDTEHGTKKFLQFLKDELFVHIGNKYRTREYRILFGHSLAGYFTLYAFLKEPSLFDSYISSSPSLRSPERLNLLADLLEKSSSDSFTGKYVYFTAGGNEGVELHESIRAFDGLLRKKKIEGLSWSFNIFEGEGHVPIKGFYQGLMNNFSGWIPPLEFFRSGSLGDIKDHYSRLTKRFGFMVLPPTAIVNSAGRRYLQNNESQKAIEIYKYFVSLYPKSASGYLALGESYIQTNKIDLAIQHLRKALELEPDNAQARKLLEDLLKRK